MAQSAFVTPVDTFVDTFVGEFAWMTTNTGDRKALVKQAITVVGGPG
jgi:hypothetical protein